MRPFASGPPILRGVRLTGFYFGDNYIKDAERTRAVGEATFESKYLNAGFDAIKARDQPSIRSADVEASGWSWCCRSGNEIFCSIVMLSNSAAC